MRTYMFFGLGDMEIVTGLDESSCKEEPKLYLGEM